MTSQKRTSENEHRHTLTQATRLRWGGVGVAVMGLGRGSLPQMGGCCCCYRRQSIPPLPFERWEQQTPKRCCLRNLLGGFSGKNARLELLRIARTE